MREDARKCRLDWLAEKRTSVFDGLAGGVRSPDRTLLQREFPDKQGICREFFRIGANLPFSRAEARPFVKVSDQIPCATEQGIIFAEQGKIIADQGNRGNVKPDRGGGAAPNRRTLCD
jgi:hypothetical protein